MVSLKPHPEARVRMVRTIVASIVFPGLGHALLGRLGWAFYWALLCQGLLFGGMALAGATALDFGQWLGFDGARLVFFALPEAGNLGGLQLAASMLQSVEAGGTTPDLLPWRHLGHLLSGASGILAVFGAAHGASFALMGGAAKSSASPTSSSTTHRLSPGMAALAALMIPGLGHWLLGRRFKAIFLGGIVLGLFFLGMALGDFADMERWRHPWYWAGQMLGGPVFWLVSLFSASQRFTEVLPFQDAGLLFTTAAGMFQGVLALDAWHRAEEDLFPQEPTA